jgi:archaellum biogenesis ATPase FlaH
MSKVFLSTERRLKDLEEASMDDEALWGPFLLKGALTLLVGESSAGKTVFLYRLAHALAAGEEFLGIAPPLPLRIGHLDLESPDWVQKSHLQATGTHENWAVIPDPSNPPLIDMLAAEGGEFDLLIIDSLQVYAPVRHEDDNAEANRQMTALVKLARQTKAAVLITCNSGKSDTEEKFKLRGASARIDRADIVVNLDVVKDNRSLKIVKSRHGFLDEGITFRFDGDLNYALVTGLTPATTRIEEMKEKVCRALSDGKAWERRNIASLLRVVSGSANDQLLTRALRGLKEKDQRIGQPKKGVYALKLAPEEGLDMMEKCYIEPVSKCLDPSEDLMAEMSYTPSKAGQRPSRTRRQ